MFQCTYFHLSSFYLSYFSHVFLKLLKVSLFILKNSSTYTFGD